MPTNETTTNNRAPGRTLVLGGTGKTGSRVLRRLRELELPARAGSRSGEPRFDWADQTTWEPVLRGVTSAYLAYSPDAGFPGAADTIRSFAKLAAESGVERLVLLSGRGEAGARRSEQAVRDSGTEWTVVRSSFFAQNFSEDFLVDGVRTGVVAFAAADVGEPFIDVEDIAEVATAALTETGHAGQVYEVTGPRLLTFPDAVAEIGEACGRTIDYLALTPREFEIGMVEQGLPADFSAQLTSLFQDILDGPNASLADGVQRALGREPRDFADYARDTAATGVWNRGT
ncbi:NAD(P)H-binding protein [Amycolatopsis marina]|nr:NAD(P)H-binding protein [Amycolatopsis marina]